MCSIPKLEIPTVKCSAVNFFKLGLHIAKNRSNALDCIDAFRLIGISFES